MVSTSRGITTFKRLGTQQKKFLSLPMVEDSVFISDRSSVSTTQSHSKCAGSLPAYMPCSTQVPPSRTARSASLSVPTILRFSTLCRSSSDICCVSVPGVVTVTVTCSAEAPWIMVNESVCSTPESLRTAVLGEMLSFFSAFSTMVSFLTAFVSRIDSQLPSCSMEGV